jgi:hypothetical protein
MKEHSLFTKIMEKLFTVFKLVNNDGKLSTCLIYFVSFAPQLTPFLLPKRYFPNYTGFHRKKTV